MKISQIILNAALALIAGNSFAASYQSCSEQLQTSLIQQFKLVNHQFSDSDAKTYKSCINLDSEQKIHLLAISQPIAFTSYDDMEHDLNFSVHDKNR